MSAGRGTSVRLAHAAGRRPARLTGTIQDSGPTQELCKAINVHHAALRQPLEHSRGVKHPLK